MMNPLRASWWQACLAGFLAGAVLAGGRILSQENKPIGGEEFVSRDFFEQMAHLRTPDGDPFIQSITVYNRGNIDLLSFNAYDELTRAYTVRWLAVPRPYMRAGSRHAVRSIDDYLVTLKRTIPDLSVRHAWWSEPRAVFLIYASGGALVGLLLPLVRWFRRRPQPEFLVVTVGTTPSADIPVSGAKPDVADAARRRLEELEDEMVAGLSSSPREAPRGLGTGALVAPQPTTICPLQSEEPIAQLAVSAKNKEYAGEYYPVVKKGHHGGFTLIELLVIIGIIVLLLSILLPAVSRVRAHAVQAKCASNLRQIGAGLELYNQTYHFLPLVAAPAGLNDAMTEMKVVGLVTCPNDFAGTLSYAMNAAYAGLPKAQGNPTEALAFETGVGHEGRFNTVYFDGHVDDQPRSAP